MVVAAVDEYANAIQVQGGSSSSEQSSPLSAESAIQKELARAKAAHLVANQNKEPS